ncbi:phosphate ABC transporter ATP-binding protein [Alicyclobacillus fodiniaquatilis]|jgi:putative ABC transport system ATP-binding protein|uniref:Phosphate ABC transporter ATP-binding protein n=1 Tax=Alicyclobacillus fodiniaquatilis TaxID=1661150 RepID=A0ABW4JL34_9BACL
MATTAIRFEQVHFEVDGHPLLKEIHANVKAGGITALIGPSGAGKSTLLSLCNLLRTPTAGHIYVDDKEVRDWDIQVLRQKVGMVFQSPTIFPGTVEDNLAYGLRLHGKSLADGVSLLRDVGLSEDLLQQAADELSGGQKQRIALGRTLAMEPQILLLDEVTSALDVHAKQEVERTILALQKKINATILWVTHDLAQAKRVAEDVWFMQDGQLVESAPADDFFYAPATSGAKAFLEHMEVTEQ